MRDENKFVELKLYSPLHVDIIDLDNKSDGWPEDRKPAISLLAVGHERINAYTEWALSAIQKIQPQEDARGRFLQYTNAFGEVSENIVSIYHTVERIEGRLFGVAVCRLREPPSPDDVHDMKYYCSEQYGEGWGDGYAHCSRGAPFQGAYIHFWQDEDDRLLTRQELDAALKAGQITGQKVFLGIDKDTFWELIAEAKRRWGQNLDGSVKWLEDQLLMMGPHETQNFYNFLQGYMELSDRYGLWNAAILMLEDRYGTEGFMHFRLWLIAQGKETYLAALKDPDSLADVPLYGEGRFARLYDLADRAFEKQTGRSDISGQYEQIREALLAELRQDIQYGAEIGYPHEWLEMEAYLPRLASQHMTPEELRACARCGRLWNHSDPDIQKARAAMVKKERTKHKQMKRGDPR